MCVLYMSFGSNVRPRTFRCITMGSTVLFILRFKLLLYSVGSGVNRMLSFVWIQCEIVRFCPDKILCRYGCMYFLAALLLVCIDVIWI